MGDPTNDPPPEGAPKRSLPRKVLAKLMNGALEVPAHVSQEVSRVVGDARHVTHGDLDKVSLDTQIWIAKKAQALATGDKTVNLAIPIPGVPDLTIGVSFKDLSEVAKGKPQGFSLNYEVYRW